MVHFVFLCFGSCRPTSPCPSCAAQEHLRKHLTDEQYTEFLKILGEITDDKLALAGMRTPWSQVLELSIRTARELDDAGIYSLGELVVKTPGQLKKLAPGLGVMSLNQLKDELARFNLYLGMRVHEME